MGLSKETQAAVLKRPCPHLLSSQVSMCLPVLRCRSCGRAELRSKHGAALQGEGEGSRAVPTEGKVLAWLVSGRLWLILSSFPLQGVAVV